MNEDCFSLETVDKKNLNEINLNSRYISLDLKFSIFGNEFQFDSNSSTDRTATLVKCSKFRCFGLSLRITNFLLPLKEHLQL